MSVAHLKQLLVVGLFLSFFQIKFAFSDVTTTQKMSVQEQLEHHLCQLQTQNIISKKAKITFMNASNVKIIAFTETLQDYLKDSNDKNFRQQLTEFIDQVERTPVDQNKINFFDYQMADFTDANDQTEMNQANAFTFKSFHVAVQKKLFLPETEEEHVIDAVENKNSNEVPILIVSYSIATADYNHKKQMEVVGAEKYSNVTNSLLDVLSTSKSLFLVCGTILICAVTRLYFSIMSKFKKSEKEEPKQESETIDQSKIEAKTAQTQQTVSFSSEITSGFGENLENHNEINEIVENTTNLSEAVISFSLQTQHPITNNLNSKTPVTNNHLSASSPLPPLLEPLESNSLNLTTTTQISKTGVTMPTLEDHKVQHICLSDPNSTGSVPAALSISAKMANNIDNQNGNLMTEDEDEEHVTNQ